MRLKSIVLLILTILGGVLFACRPQQQVVDSKIEFGQPQIAAVKGDLPLLSATVLDFGKEVFHGNLDLNPTIRRIREGHKLPHRNDGANFGNREHLLPSESFGYYREFVVPIDHVKQPGPARLIIGKGGEVWFTGDHYAAFQRVNP